ncbi:MAG: tetratricopeptide repeat protein [Halothiobacillaceae bacterium]|nr:tetratricopeptide repeat protein [Halothiobacillaceae bacterium]
MRWTSPVALILIGLMATATGCATDSTDKTPEPETRGKSAADLGTASAGPIFHLLAGEIYGRQSQYDQAAGHYAQVALKSENINLIERAIQAAIFADRFDLAQKLAERLRDLDPNNARAAAVLMISSLELDKTAAADRALNAWLTADAGNVETIFNEVGQYLRKSLDRDKAIAYTHHLAKRFPNQYEAQLVVSKLALSFGELELAQESVNRAMALRPAETAPYDLAMVIVNRRGDVDEAVRILRKAHERFPSEGRYASGLIEAQLSAGSDEAALALLKRTLDRRPEDPNLLRNLALFAFELERPDLGERALSRLQRIPGQADVVHLIRGRIALSRGDLDAAEDALAEVSSRSEHYANAQVLLSAARMELSKTQAAIRGLKAALDEADIDEADRQQLTLTLASALAESGQLEASLQLADQALEDWPEANDFRMQKAMTLFALDRGPAAKRVLREIIERDPEHAAALNALGYTLADNDERLDEAERLITRALHLDPDNPAYLDSLGWLNFRQGELDKARKALEMAYRESPNAEIGAHLGEVLWADDQRERALTVWQESLALDPTDSTLLETLRRLAPELLPASDRL